MTIATPSHTSNIATTHFTSFALAGGSDTALAIAPGLALTTLSPNIATKTPTITNATPASWYGIGLSRLTSIEGDSCYDAQLRHPGREILRISVA